MRFLRETMTPAPAPAFSVPLHTGTNGYISRWGANLSGSAPASALREAPNRGHRTRGEVTASRPVKL
ncbi:MAG: hypothetical protein ABS61_05290 [Microbacterium sp. SCN 70-18]|nr:hypothetical protein [Microbacterium chocolatum]ODT11121.1 MAG: hypothetical protein ABS61_05290 [Microbacterium sp. SCN 70-18]